VLALGGLALALWFFTANDGATTSAPVVAPPGQAYDGPAPLTADLRRGNVVLEVADARETAAAGDLAAALGDHRDADLRAAGQAVLVISPGGLPDALSEPDLRVTGDRPRVTAYAAGRRLAVRSADDPRLRAFVEYWLGRAAG
jgi:hypothetical protein